MEHKTTQTPVQWLFNQLWDCPKDKFVWRALLSKALEMEESNKPQQGELTPHEYYIAGYKTGQSDFQKYNLPLIMADQVPDVRKMVEISDEEIEEMLFHNSNEYAYGFKDAIKWYREQLKQRQ